jgi:hypothetical protein
MYDVIIIYSAVFDPPNRTSASTRIRTSQRVLMIDDFFQVSSISRGLRYFINHLPFSITFFSYFEFLYSFRFIGQTSRLNTIPPLSSKVSCWFLLFVAPENYILIRHAFFFYSPDHVRTHLYKCIWTPAKAMTFLYRSWESERERERENLFVKYGQYAI